MKLNTITPMSGSRPPAKRVGRGAASGWGKTCGRGQKGQKSRSGGTVARGFEGGQMPLQMRLPKFGFSSRLAQVTAEVRLSDLSRLSGDEVTFKILQEAGIVRHNMKRARIILSGSVDKAFTVSGIHVTTGARKLIEAAGGKIV